MWLCLDAGWRANPEVVKTGGTRYGAGMQRAIWILALSINCATPNGVRRGEQPLTIALEETTTLRVGDAAVLHIPADEIYSPAVDGAWQDVLTLVDRSGRDVTFRAVRQGTGVIVIGPKLDANTECVSCVTLHYFIKVS